MDQASHFVRPAISVVVAAALAWLVTFVVQRAVRRIQTRSPSVVWSSLQRRCRWPFRSALGTAALLMSLPYTGLNDEVTEIARQILVIALIAAVTWLVAQLILVAESPLWDRQDWVLQVVDTTPSTMVLRGLVSSADAPTTWDLRCDLREGLLTYLREHHPDTLPKVRASVSSSDSQPPSGPGESDSDPGPSGDDVTAPLSAQSESRRTDGPHIPWHGGPLRSC
jgi:hypothetical protein